MGVTKVVVAAQALERVKVVVAVKVEEDVERLPDTANGSVSAKEVG